MAPLPSDPLVQQAAIERLVRAHLERYPLLAIEDLYKVLHQGTFGSEHAVRNETAARDWLSCELAALGPGPREPMIDPISPDGQIVRVHLRPYRAAGGDPDSLLRAFIRTAHEHHGRAEDLVWAWHAAGSLPGSVLPFSRQAMAAFLAPLEAAGLPAVHHSQPFERAYKPAYRVVRADLLSPVEQEGVP